VLASAAGMDKEFAKKLMAADGLPIGDYLVLRPGQDAPATQDIARLGFPLFVKPSREGTGMGVSADSIVRSEAELREARKRVTFALLADEEDMEKVTAEVESLFMLLQRGAGS